MHDKTITKIIKKDNIREWVTELIKNYDVIAPVKVDKDTFFRRISTADEINFDFISGAFNTKVPPTEFFLARSEIIFEFNGENVDAGNTENNAKKNRIIFGIRPCDVYALNLLDKVYNENFEDVNYREKREKTSMISFNCTSPGENCFCESVISEDKVNADVILTDIGGKFYVEAKQGKLLMPYELFEECTGDDKKIKEKNRKEFKNKFSLSMNLKNLEKLDSVFNDKYWSKVARTCISCGVCTFLCPACYCFNVFDESKVTEQKGKRVKCRDSCQFPDFTLLAGGENPRKTKGDRLKQRIYHKFRYFPGKYGELQCTGCGRCISLCPVNINIIHIIEDLDKI